MQNYCSNNDVSSWTFMSVAVTYEACFVTYSLPCADITKINWTKFSTVDTNIILGPLLLFIFQKNIMGEIDINSANREENF